MTRQAQQDKAWDMWLDCVPQTEIGERLGVPRTTVSDWVTRMEQRSEIVSPPESRQHFDIWQFPTTDRDGGPERERTGTTGVYIRRSANFFAIYIIDVRLFDVSVYESSVRMM